ncbi:MAG TPA: glycosyltransferase family 39 protein [Acidobacteriaceae bacterium]|nr:glycosyltransferase family 39 protein [Acidobacteriaceae bacterium]
MLPTISDTWLTRLRWLTVAAFAGIFGYYIAMTIHWAVITDSAVMHYIVFMMSRGLRPYVDIGDINMPGTYLTERWGMAIFGWSDLSWRIYEFFLMAVLTVSGMVIGGRRRWLAGIFAAAFFIIMHGADGPFVSMERDELMMVLLVAATAALCLAVRRRSAVLMLLFGLSTGVAISIKPTVAPLDLALLAIAFVVVRRRGRSPLPYLGWALLGNAAIAAVVVGFLWHNHAFGAFFFILRKVLPAYSQSSSQNAGFLVRNLFPTGLLRVLPFAVVAALLHRRRMGWEQWALLSGAAVGAASYFLQGKGYVYHRYTFVVFLLLWVGLELADAMRRADLWSRATGAAGVLALLLLVLPHYVRVMHRDAQAGHTVGNAGLPNSELTTILDRDLVQLGGDRLQRKVFCLDVVNSCLNGLYRLRLLGNNGSTGDLLLFSPTETPLVDYYRNLVWKQQQTDPADVVVLGNEWFLGAKPSFRKLDTWPVYKSWLEANYVDVVERRLPGADAQAYRLYLRKGSEVLASEQSHPLQ